MNYNMNPYWPYNSQQYNFTQQPQQQQVNDGTIMAVLVQGENAAINYPVAAGGAVLLIDFESGKFWLKSNINGIPQKLRSFSFYEDNNNEESNKDITRAEFDTLSSNVSLLAEKMSKLISDLGGGVSNE